MRCTAAAADDDDADAADAAADVTGLRHKGCSASCARRI